MPEPRRVSIEPIRIVIDINLNVNLSIDNVPTTSRRISLGSRKVVPKIRASESKAVTHDLATEKSLQEVIPIQHEVNVDVTNFCPQDISSQVPSENDDEEDVEDDESSLERVNVGIEEFLEDPDEHQVEKWVAGVASKVTGFDQAVNLQQEVRYQEVQNVDDFRSAEESSIAQAFKNAYNLQTAPVIRTDFDEMNDSMIPISDLPVIITKEINVDDFKEDVWESAVIENSDRVVENSASISSENKDSVDVATTVPVQTESKVSTQKDDIVLVPFSKFIESASTSKEEQENLKNVTADYVGFTRPKRFTFPLKERNSVKQNPAPQNPFPEPPITEPVKTVDEPVVRPRRFTVAPAEMQHDVLEAVVNSGLKCEAQERIMKKYEEGTRRARHQSDYVRIEHVCKTNAYADMFEEDMVAEAKAADISLD